MEPAKVTVLLIEKDVTEVARIQAFLSEGQQRIPGAPDMELLNAPEPAQVKATEHPPDVILFSLPETESDPAGALVRSRAALPARPIIVLNGHSQDSYVHAVPPTCVVNFLESGRLTAHGLHQAIMQSLEYGRIQQQLAESEMRYRRLVENTQDLIYRYRLAEPRGFEYVSPSATALTGYTPEEHYADPDLGFKIVHPDDHHLLEATANCDVPSGQLIELRWVKKDGSIFWTEQRNVTIYDEAGKPIAIEGIARDISKRKHVESALKASERFAYETLDSLTTSIAILDETGRIVAVNRSWRDFAQTNGMDPALVSEGTNYLAVCDAATGQNAEEAAAVAAGIRAVLVGEEISCSFEYPCHSPNEKRWFVVRITKFSGEGPVQIVVAHENITERKLAEADLHLRSAALEAAANAIVITDTDGIIQWANPAFTDLTGHPLEKAIGRSTRMLKSGKQPLEFYKRLWDTILGGEVWQGELVNRRKDGTWYTEQMTITPVRSDGEAITHFIAIKEDITERLAQEKQERRSQRLESIGTLAGGLAHDLNNALAPIALYLDMMRLKYPDSARQIDVIEAGVKRSGEMVRQLVTFARGTEGERVLVQLNHLLKEMQSIASGTFPKNIHVDVDHDKMLPPVLGDATQLHQVLLNLCVNARDAMPNGGTLTMQTTRQELDAQFAAALPDVRPGHYVRLRVKDTGMGMTPEVMERIFEPFFTTKTPDRGAGLGLSTVLGIVKRHGGFPRIESQPGRGTTFDIYLPVAEGPGAEEAWPSERKEQLYGQGETILLVDDDAAMREIGHVVLGGLNYELITARDGAEGLMKVAKYRTVLSAIITDFQMPEMDGLGFVRALRYMLPEIPVIVTSGYMEEATAVQFQALGVAARLDKPFTEAQLAEALQQLLATQRRP